MMSEVKYAVIEETETDKSINIPDSIPRQVIKGVYESLYEASEQTREIHKKSGNRVYIQEVISDSTGEELKHIYLTHGVYKYSLYVFKDIETKTESNKLSPGEWAVGVGEIDPSSLNISLEGSKLGDYRYKDGVIYYEGEDQIEG